MTKDKSPAKPYETSYTLVIIASLVIALVMPFVRAVARGDHEVSVFAAAHTASASPLNRADGADEVSMLAVGAFLLGLGFVLRRVA
jgi:hypothetical protein